MRAEDGPKPSPKQVSLGDQHGNCSQIGTPQFSGHFGFHRTKMFFPWNGWNLNWISCSIASESLKSKKYKNDQKVLWTSRKMVEQFQESWKMWLNHISVKNCWKMSHFGHNWTSWGLDWALALHSRRCSWATVKQMFASTWKVGVDRGKSQVEVADVLWIFVRAVNTSILDDFGGYIPSHSGRNKMKPTNPNADTYVEEQRQYLFLTFSSEPTCETPWVDTLRWHSCKTPLLDTIAQRSGKTLLLDTLIWHSCVTLLYDTLTWRSYLILLTWPSYLTLLLDTSY